MHELFVSQKAAVHEPRANTKLVVAGFGEQTAHQVSYGSLNEANQMVQGPCSTSRVLCIYSWMSGLCAGDSGDGVVTAGSPPTLLGIMSRGSTCYPDGYHMAWTVYLAVPTVLRFIKA
jgi:hypothetical protein